MPYAIGYLETDHSPRCSGIGKFTIADDAIVSDSDLGVNFFLDENSRGRPRAECCTELLVELNPEVQGDWWPKPNVRPYRILYLHPLPHCTYMQYRPHPALTSFSRRLSPSQ